MQVTKKKAVSVKDKLDGNEIDMSMLGLTDVPVKELAAVSRGTVLDLSNNLIVLLPVSFSTLTHLVKLDLSKNQLKELPPNFGDLQRLRHLDLYSNELQRLPVSFYQLKELRWLDLKNNPLVPTLAEAAGDCLDQKGCQNAAKKVVKLMTVVHTELQKKRNKEQEEIQLQQNVQRSEEDRAREKQRLQKKLEKEKRKTEAAKQSASVARSEMKTTANHTTNFEKKRSQNLPQHRQIDSKPQGRSLCTSFFVWILRLLLLTTVAAGMTLYLNWEGPLTLSNSQMVAEKWTRKTVVRLNDAQVQMAPLVEDMRKQWSHLYHFVAQRMTHHGEALRQHFHIVWPIVKNRCYELLTVIGENVMNCWQTVCREAPVYYDMVSQKVTELFE